MKKNKLDATKLIKMMSRNKFPTLPKHQVIPNKKKKDPKYPKEGE